MRKSSFLILLVFTSCFASADVIDKWIEGGGKVVEKIDSDKDPLDGYILQSGTDGDPAMLAYTDKKRSFIVFGHLFTEVGDTIVNNSIDHLEIAAAQQGKLNNAVAAKKKSLNENRSAQTPISKDENIKDILSNLVVISEGNPEGKKIWIMYDSTCGPSKDLHSRTSALALEHSINWIPVTLNKKIENINLTAKDLDANALLFDPSPGIATGESVLAVMKNTRLLEKFIKIQTPVSIIDLQDNGPLKIVLGSNPEKLSAVLSL